MTPNHPGWSGSAAQWNGIRNAAPCAHCGSDVEEDDAFRLVEGELLHEACVDEYESKLEKVGHAAE